MKIENFGYPNSWLITTPLWPREILATLIEAYEHKYFQIGEVIQSKPSNSEWNIKGLPKKILSLNTVAGLVGVRSFLQNIAKRERWGDAPFMGASIPTL